MNEPRVIESVTNECQLLGRAHESSSARAEQLIACLEGEIAKRDEELAACRVAVENCEVFRARIAELQRAEKNDAIAYKAALERQDELRAELAALKAQGVVMPERSNERGSNGELTYEAKAHNRCLDEVARLNAAPVQQVSVPDGLELIKRMQVCLSLDDTEWGLSAPEKYKLLGDIKSYVLAAPAAPAADAGVTTND